MVSTKRFADPGDDSDEVSLPSGKRPRLPSTPSLESLGPIYPFEGKEDLTIVRNPHSKDPQLLRVPASHYVKESKELLREVLSDDEDESDDEDAESDEDLPVLLLNKFVFFDDRPDQREHPTTSPEELDDSGTQDIALHFIGVIDAKKEEGDDNDLVDTEEEIDMDAVEGVFLYSTVVMLYYLDANPTKPMLWLRTQYAWYICDRPALFYQAEYLDFWKPRYLARLVIACTSTRFLKHYKDYHGLDEDDITAQVEFGGAVGVQQKAFTDAEIEASRSNSRAFVAEVLEDVDGDELCDEIFNEVYESELSSKYRPRQRQGGSHPPRQLPSRKKRGKAIPKIFMTPTIEKVVTAIWLTHHESTSSETDGITCDPATVIQEALSFPYGKSDGQPWELTDCAEEEIETLLHHKRISVDAYLCASSSDSDLAANDFVAIRGETEEDNKEIWFGSITYFFEGDDGGGSDTWAHVRWLQHMCQSRMEGASHPRELFLLNECGNIPLSSVAGKIRVKVLQPDESEPPYKKEKKDSFFLRYVYEAIGKKGMSFIDVAQYGFDKTELADESPLFLGCWNCQHTAASDLAKTPRLSDDHDKLDLNGVRYHKLDFVFLPPLQSRKESQPFRIGQIEDFTANGNAVTVRIHLFDRHDAQARDNEERGFEQHKLYASKDRQDVDSINLRGLLSVLSIDDILDLAEWTNRGPHFYVDSTSSPNVRPCKDETCVAKRNANAEKPNVLPTARKRRAMELFHGAGGLSLGLEQAGGFEVCWGVDRDTSACKTFEMNHPNAVSICGDASDVLRKAHDYPNGEHPHGTNTRGNSCTLPKPGEVDVLVTGPPCQGFSLMNIYRSYDDEKNKLVATALSAIDLLKPDYGMLENVPSLTSLTMKRRHNETGTLPKLDKAALTKAIVRVMMKLGYQCRWTIVQANQYGVPQTRERYILLTARRGLLLPDFPIPTHTPALNAKTNIKPTAAPFPFTTIWDAIGDLPSFHWLNPKLQYPMAQTIGGDSYDAVSADKRRTGSTGPINAQYVSAPLTRYQAKCRGTQTHVQHHVTPTFTKPSIVERICNVPLRPGASHRDLPHVLSIQSLSLAYTRGYRHSKGAKGRLARVSKDEASGTVVTAVNPAGIQGRVLHPTQNRIYTARECARLQGFPDSYKLEAQDGKIQEIYKLIGNAVPIPLARALGLELRKCFQD